MLIARNSIQIITEPAKPFTMLRLTCYKIKLIVLKKGDEGVVIILILIEIKTRKRKQKKKDSKIREVGHGEIS